MIIDLFFSGLIAFALGDKPVDGKCSAGTDGQVHVLMLKGSPGEPHRARFMVDVRQIKPKLGSDVTSDPDEIVSTQDSSGHEVQMAVWNLDDQGIVFEDAPAIRLGRGNRVEGKGNRRWESEIPGAKDSDEHFSWLANLQDACPEAGIVRHECVLDPPQCEVVSSRSTFRYSQASRGSWLAPSWEQRPDKSQVYGFSGKDYSQALADRVRVRMQTATDSMTIRLKPFDGIRPSRTIILAKGSEPITATISNLPVSLPDPTVSRDQMHHFHAFYELLSNPASAARCPIPTLKYPTAAIKPVACAICTACDE